MNNEDEEEYVDGQAPLDLSRVGAISEKSVNEAQAKIFAMLDDAKNELTRRGILDMPKPKNHPLPLADMNVNDLTNSEVAGLYTQYVAYASYIGDELAEIECLEEAAKRMLRETLGKLKDAQFAKGLKGAEATAASISDPFYQELDFEHLRFLFMKNIMKRRYRHYTSQASALSRTVELRKLDFESQRRDINIGRGRPPAAKMPAPTGFGARRSPASG